MTADTPSDNLYDRSLVYSSLSQLVEAYKKSNIAEERNLAYQNVQNLYNSTIQIFNARINASEGSEAISKDLIDYGVAITNEPDLVSIMFTPASIAALRFAYLDKNFGCFEKQSGLWTQLLVLERMSKQMDGFVDSGALQILLDGKLPARCKNRTDFLDAEMRILSPLVMNEKYCGLVIREVIDVFMAVDLSSSHSIFFLKVIVDSTTKNRWLMDKFKEDYELVKNFCMQTRKRNVKEMLITLFGDVFEQESVSFFVEYSVTKKKFSFPIDKSKDVTVEEVSQFILEKCFDDVESVIKHHLEIYDEDIEDFIDFEDIEDQAVFQQVGGVIKFKLTATVDVNRPKPSPQKQVEPTVKDISVSSVSSHDLSETSNDSLFDLSIKEVSSTFPVENNHAEKSGPIALSGVEMSALQMSGMDMSGIAMSGIAMSGFEMSGANFSEQDDSPRKGPLDMDSVLSVIDPKDNQENGEPESAMEHDVQMSLISGFSEMQPVESIVEKPQALDKNLNTIVNETYQLIKKVETQDYAKKVFIAKDRTNKAAPNLAIKYIPVRSTTEFNRYMKEGVNMIRMGRLIQQKKVPLANIFDVFEEEDKKTNIRYLCMAMPYYTNGNLSDYIKKQRVSSVNHMDFIIMVAKQATSALQFLHEQKSAHKNIKTNNVFMQQNDDCMSVVLGDYGVVTGMSNAPELKNQEQQEITVDMYQKADVWQLGLMLSQMCLGQEVSSPFDLLVKNGPDAFQEKLGESVPQPLRSALTQMLNKEPTQRPTLQSILSTLASL